MKSRQAISRAFSLVSSVLFFLFVSFFLVSCGKEVTQTPVPENKENSRVLDNSNTGVIQKSGSTTTITTEQDNKTSSGVSVTTPGKEQTKMVELQEKQKLLQSAMADIQAPGYKEAMENIVTIRQARELWTPELKALYTRFQELQKKFGTGTELYATGEFKELTAQREVLRQSFREKPSYKEYIQKNQSKLDALNMEMKKYWTPKMMNLDKEIANLMKEIYGDAIPK